jgi:hypothetical protein
METKKRNRRRAIVSITVIIFAIISLITEFLIPIPKIKKEAKDMNIEKIVFLDDNEIFDVYPSPHPEIGEVVVGDVFTSWHTNAMKDNVTALLTHNYSKAGEAVLLLDQSNYIYIKEASIPDLLRYETQFSATFWADNPNDIHTSFKDDIGEEYSNEDVFKLIYANETYKNGDNYIVLQTCVQKNGVDNAGRIFIIAKLISPL